MSHSLKVAGGAQDKMRNLAPKRVEAVRGGFFGGLLRKLKGVAKETIKN